MEPKARISPAGFPLFLKDGYTKWGFRCPALNEVIMIDVRIEDWDGSLLRPTFKNEFVCTYFINNKPDGKSKFRVTEGVVTYSKESTHHLSGQTIPAEIVVEEKAAA